MWPVLAILSRIYALFGLNNNSVVMPQNWQISGMPKKFISQSQRSPLFIDQSQRSPLFIYQSQRSPLFIAALRKNSKILNDSFTGIYSGKKSNGFSLFENLSLVFCIINWIKKTAWCVDYTLHTKWSQFLAKKTKMCHFSQKQNLAG